MQHQSTNLIKKRGVKIKRIQFLKSEHLDFGLAPNLKSKTIYKNGSKTCRRKPPFFF